MREFLDRLAGAKLVFDGSRHRTDHDFRGRSQIALDREWRTPLVEHDLVVKKPRALARIVQADASSRAGRPRDEPAAQQALEIEHRVDLPAGWFAAQPVGEGKRAGGSAEAMARKKVHRVEQRIFLEQRRPLGVHRPADVGLRPPAPGEWRRVGPESVTAPRRRANSA